MANRTNINGTRLTHSRLLNDAIDVRRLFHLLVPGRFKDNNLLVGWLVGLARRQTSTLLLGRPQNKK